LYRWCTTHASSRCGAHQMKFIVTMFVSRPPPRACIGVRGRWSVGLGRRRVADHKLKTPVPSTVHPAPLVTHKLTLSNLLAVGKHSPNYTASQSRRDNYSMYSSINSVKQSRIGWAGYVARMEEKIYACKFFWKENLKNTWMGR
jgi:hypothetical protein